MKTFNQRESAIPWQPRLAREGDIPALEQLVPISVRALQAAHYSPAQIDAALGPVFGVDRQLVRDGTYFVIEREGQILGSGGWSKRQSRYGSDTLRAEPDAELDPRRDPARIRAFFVHPAWARRGLARSIMTHCESAIAAAGFSHVEIVATLCGEPLYSAFGYAVLERYSLVLPGDLQLPVVRMAKDIPARSLHLPPVTSMNDPVV